MQSDKQQKQQQQHGYPTPPHSPNFDSPPSTPPSSSSRDSPTPTPTLPQQQQPQENKVDAFDPLAGYTGAHEQPADSSSRMNSAEGGGGAPAASAGSSAPPPAAGGAGRRASVASTFATGVTGQQQQARRRGSRSDFATVGSGGVGGGGERDSARVRVWTKEEKKKAKMFPPSGVGRDVLFDTEQEWQEHHDKESTSGWHHLPLVLVALPPLGAIVHGRAENWSDAIILLLICFYLYQLIKVPWELYYASHARIVLPQPTSSSTSPSTSPPSPPDPLAEARLSSAASLRRSELLSLFLTFLVPLLGASLLHYARGLLSDPERYINRSVIGLFCIAASVRPLGRAGEIWRRNTLYHQSLVHYPSSEVYQLRKRVEGLEHQLASLSPNFATRSSLTHLSHTLSHPIQQLDKSLRRSSRAQDFFRLSTEEKLAALEGEMGDVREREEEREREVEELRRRVEVGEASVSRVALQVARHLLLLLARSALAATDERRELGWYEKGAAWYLFWPVNLPRACIGWGVERAIEVVGLPSTDGGGGGGVNGGRNGGGKRLGGRARKRVEAAPRPLDEGGLM